MAGRARSERAAWRSAALGPAQRVAVHGGHVPVHVTGTGPPIVFVHGGMVNANLWRKVVPLLDGFKRVALDLPLGSHIEPMPGRSLTPPDVAELIGEVIQALGLEDVTLVGNDTGGALCQIAAASRPAWLGRLVLTSCDAFENFPPPPLRQAMPVLKLPGAIPILLGWMRSDRLRQLPIGYGSGVHRPIDREAADSYALPWLTRRDLRADLRRLAASIDNSQTLAAAEALRDFDRPALIAWSVDDRFFPPADAERLAATIPSARLEWIEDSRTFSAEDRPERLAELIAGFMREPVGARRVDGMEPVS